MNPYKILGITDQASDEEVKRAYRAMAAKYHPDVGGDAWVFEQVRDAYDRILKMRRPAVQASAHAAAAPPTSQKAPPHSSSQTPPPKPGSTSAYSSQPSGQRPAASANANTATSSGSATDATTRSATSLSAIYAKTQRAVAILFRHQLPLQSETSYFILANVLDIVITNALLRMHAIEANPIANYVLIHWGFNGMIAFKLFLVACVCLVTQLIALHHLRRARQTLYLGTVIVGIVVLYSGQLLVRS